jgi:hypothetical protein
MRQHKRNTMQAIRILLLSKTVATQTRHTGLNHLCSSVMVVNAGMIIRDARQ